MRAILHLGDQKTGTTSIQTTLEQNRSSLRARGVVVPSSTKSGVHDMGIGALAVGEGRWARTFARAQELGRIDRVSEHLTRHLPAELDGAELLVLSFEGLLWLTPGQIDRVRSWLEQFVDEVHLVAFLRRQDRKAVSLYTTKLMLGRGSLQLLPKDGQFDYWAALDNWRRFGSATSTSIHVYEDDPDSWRVFARNLPDLEGVTIPERQNVSLGGKAQAVLRVLRTHHSDELASMGEALRLRQLIRSTVQGGTRRLPSADAARAFVERFEDGNAKICSTFELDRERLFDDDYSEYTLEREPVSFDADDMATLALALWAERERR